MFQFILYMLYFLLTNIIVLIISPILIYFLAKSYYLCFNCVIKSYYPKDIIEPIILTNSE